MKKQLLVYLLFIVTIAATAQKLQSPEEFLGYKTGAKFTPHYKIVEYVKSVAAARPDMVKVEKYGETFEGRELLVAYISSATNLQNLETIRMNNLRAAGIMKDKSAASVEGSPAIVWLSYNVHGNEPSSSEAAMQTLYALADPSNAKTKDWLKNTVVIIDPCMNPDGRDRYVNWFTSVSGKDPNPDVQSREHDEPWPGGRSNHYNFDLNRDWAWQTQIETQQRMVKYNSWLPHVHVDFHEQYFNNPYYFAPAAEPFHEVITPWQRDFQNTIGKNNAKYFDESGWLYFTKESFDLFYPSYGDTYPLYSGAIGMTYEQGGHSRAGLAVITNAGDTLHLADRVLHHYTSGLSTIEAASKNAQRLAAEFKNFYAESVTGKNNMYKTYVLTTDNAAKANSLIALLKRNGIEYGTFNKDFRGFNYETGKEEKAQLKRHTIAISSAQPKSVLVKVLLEPRSNLADSVTYDITAWSLPYAYDMDAYASKDILSVQPYTDTAAAKTIAVSDYGYLIRYNSVGSVKLLGQLLKSNIKVRYSEKSFTYNKKQYDRGTLIVLQKGNPANLPGILNDLAATTSAEIEPVTTGFMEKGPDFGSVDIKFIKAPKVAMLTGDDVSSTGAGEIWHLFEQQLDYPVSLINSDNLKQLNLRGYTTLILPDGNYTMLSDKSVMEKLKDFVTTGGNVIVLENAAQQLAAEDWGYKLKESKDKDKEKDKDDKTKEDYTLLKRYENRERDNLISTIPGAIYKIQLDNSHPLAFGYTNTYYTLKRDPAVYEFLKDGWNVGVIKKDNYVTGFAGSKVKKELKDGVVFGVVNKGSGTVTFMADDPLFRQFWEGGKLLFCNAVFLAGQ